MPSKNECVIIGHIGQDPELRYTLNGTAYCSFSVAENYGKKEDRKTQWHRIVVWNDLAEVVAAEFSKGDAIEVRGTYRSRKWMDRHGNDRESWELTAWNVARPVWKRKDQASTQEVNYGNDDIPF